MRRPEFQGQRWRRVPAASAAAFATALCVASAVIPASAAPAAGAAADQARHPHHGSSCQLGNGIKHVVQIGFDNVHFSRDNPNVPSDLQMMPNLLHLITRNGTLLSNNHTPLIAHTADDLLTTATGLYGDRQGMPVSNDYQSYNADGTTDQAGSFAYWTDPVYDTSFPVNPGHDTNPSMVYSATPPATTNPAPAANTITPAPWVPFTRSGCNVGEIATANQELENTAVDIPKVFGPNSAEAKQLAADKDSFKDPETADYVGIGVHCARASAFCANAEAVKFGQTTPSHTAVADVLADEPGGYSGFQGLFGHRYVAPQLGAGTPNLTHHGYAVTNAAGHLVDLNGNELDGAFLNNYPGFPGYGDINAAQSLAYAADMLESGVQVVNMYMADLHGNHFIPGLNACNNAPDALPTGSLCYIEQAKYYNQAFGKFFKRLAADGITAKNTLFVVSPDEGDHEAGANVGRALQPSPKGCDGATVSGSTVTPDVLCNYPAGTFGELAVNVTGLLNAEGNKTPFSMEADTAPEFYLTGNPGPGTPSVRGFEHEVARLTGPDPYAGNPATKLTNYLANPVEEAILHMVNADPARTPTLAMFAKPDYYLQQFPLSGSCAGKNVCASTGFAYDHGDYAAEINTNFVGFVGPGVRNLGVDGPTARQGPSSAGPNSGQITVAEEHLRGPWVDETDIRPTIMYLAGLRDDYEHDGRVISQILTDPNHALRARGVTRLGECYKQLNSSVGQFAAATLIASTNAIKSTSAGDSKFLGIDAKLRLLDVGRDRLAGLIKGELEAAAFGDRRIGAVGAQIFGCRALIAIAQRLASSS